jgi:hypothetical protein
MFMEQSLKNFLKLYTGLTYYVRENPTAIIKCSVLLQVQKLFQSKFFG